LKIDALVTSEGITSGVNCTRENLVPVTVANERAISVLARPGMGVVPHPHCLVPRSALVPSNTRPSIWAKPRSVLVALLDAGEAQRGYDQVVLRLLDSIPRMACRTVGRGAQLTANRHEHVVAAPPRA
jgi:hypothetical protein